MPKTEFLSVSVCFYDIFTISNSRNQNNPVQIKYRITFIVYTYISYLINIIYTIYTG